MQAIIFDFDGLICDTETPEFVEWDCTFREYGVEVPAGYWDDITGRGAEQEVERPIQLLARLTGQPFGSEFHESVRTRIRARIEEEPARPGIEALIDEARTDGLPIAVASSSPHAWVDRHLKRLGLWEKFPIVCCADDVERSKPFPDLYLLACRRLQMEPKISLALEDTPHGIRAAKVAGLCPVAVPNPVTARFDFSDAHAQVPTLQDVRLQHLRAVHRGWTLSGSA